MAESNGEGKQFHRFVIWGFQALLAAACIVIWSWVGKLETKIEALKDAHSLRAVELATIKADQGRYAQDVAEIKGILATVSKQVQDLTIQAGRGNRP